MLISVTPQKPTILREESVPAPTAPKVADEWLALSRSRAHAGFVEEEFSHYKSRRQPKVQKWLRFRRHQMGEYGPEFNRIKGRSDIFVRRTRERVGAAHSRIIKLTLPVVGEPWDLRPSPNPRILFEGVDPEKANEGMRRAIKDHFSTMKMPFTWRVAAHELCLYGTAIFQGPFSKRMQAPPWARVRGMENEAGGQLYPEFEHVRIFDYYGDPNATSDTKSYSGIRRRVLASHQLRELKAIDGFDPEQIEHLIKALPNGNYIQEDWESALGILPPKDPRWVVYERWGIVPDEHQDEWGLTQRTAGYLNSWTCGPFTLCMAIDPFFENLFPFMLVPYEMVDGDPYGTGPAEHLEDNQVMLNAIARSLHDNLAASSAPIQELDMTQLGPDADPNWYPGKTYQARPNELSGQRRAVNLTLIPNNSPQLVQAWGLFESQIPIVTSMPMIENPASLGSGMRSYAQQSQYYEMTESFIRDVVGNTDSFGWERFVQRTYWWEMAYGEDISIKGDLEPVCMGVRGAIRREKIAQNAELFRQLLADPESNFVLNNPRVIQLVLEGMWLDDEHVILTPDELRAKQLAIAQQEALAAGMKTMATEGATHAIRASTSRADAFLNVLRSVKTDENPAWGGLVQQAMEAQGGMTPAIYEGLRVWALKLQADLQAKVGEQEAANFIDTVLFGFKPQKAMDLDPDFRNKLGMQAPQGETTGGQELAPDAQTLDPVEAIRQEAPQVPVPQPEVQA